MTDAPQDPAAAARQRRNRIMLVAIFAIGVLPVLASYWYFARYSDGGVFATKNQGTLVKPPLAWATLDPARDPLPGGADEGPTWKLVLLPADNCAEVCREQLDTLRAMHLLLNKDAQRVRRVVALPGDQRQALAAALAEDYPRLQYAALAMGAQGILATHGVTDAALLLVDPQGNVALAYRAEQVGKPLQKDLKLLLKTSRIG